MIHPFHFTPLKKQFVYFMLRKKFAFITLQRNGDPTISVEVHSLFTVATVYCRDKMRPQMGLFVTSSQPTVGILNQFCSCTKFDIWDRVRFLSQFSDIFVLILWQRHFIKIEIFKMLNLAGFEAPLWEAARLCPKQACCSIPRQGG